MTMPDIAKGCVCTCGCHVTRERDELRAVGRALLDSFSTHQCDSEIRRFPTHETVEALRREVEEK